MCTPGKYLQTKRMISRKTISDIKWVSGLPLERIIAIETSKRILTLSALKRIAPAYELTETEIREVVDLIEKDEISSITVKDIQSGINSDIRLFGKGRKQIETKDIKVA